MKIVELKTPMLGNTQSVYACAGDTLVRFEVYFLLPQIPLSLVLKLLTGVLLNYSAFSIPHSPFLLTKQITFNCKLFSLKLTGYIDNFDVIGLVDVKISGHLVTLSSVTAIN